MLIRQKNNIRTKLIKLLLLGSLIPLTVIMILAYAVFGYYFNTEEITTNENLVYQFRHNIESEISNISKGAYYPYAINDVLQILKHSYNPTKNETIYQLLQSVAQISDNIVAVQLDSTVHERTYVYANRSLFTEADQNTAKKREGSDLQIIPLHTFSTSVETRLMNLNNTQVFSIYNSLYNIPQTEWLGSITIDISTEWIQSLAEEMTGTPEERILILESAGVTAIYDSLNSSDDYSELLTSVENMKSEKGHFQSKGKILIYV